MEQQTTPDISFIVEAFKKLTMDITPLINKKDLHTFHEMAGKFLSTELKVANLYRHQILPQTSVSLKIISNDECGPELRRFDVQEEETPTKKPKKDITVDEMKILLNESVKKNIEMVKIDSNIVWEIKVFAGAINQRFESLKMIEISMKKIQFELGLFLHYSKQYCKFNNFSFFSFIDNEIIIKSRSQINLYIQFYHLCKEHNELLFNSMTCDFIVKNNKIICKALQNQ